MPAPLRITTRKISWRIEESDLALLQSISTTLRGEGKVNELVRDVIHSYCERVRAQLAPKDEDADAA